MQPQLDPPQEELEKAKAQMTAMEEEKDRLLDELREMKKVAEQANLTLSEALLAQKGPQQCLETEKTRAYELEQASITSAQKRDQAWQLELEAVQKQHSMDMDAHVNALSSAGQEIDRIRQELVLALEAKDAAAKMAEDSRNVAEANSKRISELSAELNSVEESLANSTEQLVMKEEDKEAMRIELEKAKHIAVELEEKEASLKKLKQELSDGKESESRMLNCLSETEMQLQTLQNEMEKAKESESKTFHSFTTQTEQLDQTRNLLEEARLEVTCLLEKIENLERSSGQSSTDPGVSHCYLETPNPDSQSIEETVRVLKYELQAAKEQLAHAQEGEAQALSKVQSLTEEMHGFKIEMKLATDAEEKSRKAMDDLALALKEVLMEANLMKEKLLSSESDRDYAKEEVERLNQMLKNTEEKYIGLLSEARKEIKRIKDESERTKLEVEESNLAWNGKELGFISCIKRAEEECNDAKQESSRLLESVRQAEHVIRVSREETYKLRDILKQALNEANVAKEAAGIAQAENYQLKDSLAEKDITLQVLTRENERLRINEAAALENIKELKRLLSTTATETASPATTTATSPATSTATPPPTPPPKLAGLGAELKELEALKNRENNGSKRLAKVLHIDLEDLRVPNGYKEADGDSEIDETLKGSIFDVDSPGPIPHHRRASSSFTDDTINSEDLDILDGSQLDDLDHDRNGHRKKRALIRRFGDLLKKTSFHRREATIS
ncbi:putative WEB family protein At1g65010, chloroplastic [Macadamia integrifolia]|uniref:putative WEB family protein At1g65010, chloroplastic n=1 Tax=Macadamia integrifolia TaxID=60698 RepID=UPI001C4EF4AF|nr:putative WEB family protein At1g65010, chloroplastic [Macadamia integrifolia]